MNESNLPNVYVSLEDFTLCVQVRTKSGRLESAQSSLKLIDQVEQNFVFVSPYKRSADTAGNILLGVGFLLNSLFELFTQMFSWTLLSFLFLEVMPVAITVVVDGLLVFLYLNGREALDQPKRLSDYAAEAWRPGLLKTVLWASQTLRGNNRRQVQAGDIISGRSAKAVEAVQRGDVTREER